jgi:hypothetical protein
MIGFTAAGIGMTEQRWIVVKQTGFFVTRRTILAWALGIVGCSTLASAQVDGQAGAGSVVRLRPGEILATFKQVGNRWKGHLFPGNIGVEGADAPAVLRAMADRIEATFTTGKGGTG